MRGALPCNFYIHMMMVSKKYSQRTLTGAVSLTTALPSSLWDVTRTLGPGRWGASWFSVGGRSVEEDDMVVTCTLVVLLFKRIGDLDEWLDQRRRMEDQL